MRNVLKIGISHSFIHELAFIGLFLIPVELISHNAPGLVYK